MAAIPSQQQVKEMVQQAMLDKAPSLYFGLSPSERESAIEQRAQLFEETLESLRSAAIYSLARKAHDQQTPYETYVQELEQSDRSAVEQALAVALEFANEAVVLTGLVAQYEERFHVAVPACVLMESGPSDADLIEALQNALETGERVREWANLPAGDVEDVPIASRRSSY